MKYNLSCGADLMAKANASFIKGTRYFKVNSAARGVGVGERSWSIPVHVRNPLLAWGEVASCYALYQPWTVVNSINAPPDSSAARSKMEVTISSCARRAASWPA